MMNRLIQTKHNNTMNADADLSESAQDMHNMQSNSPGQEMIAQPKKEAKRRRKRMKHQLKTIRHQMEFYFCDANIHKDKFLMNEVKSSNDGFVDLDVFLNFNRIRSCTTDIDVIRKALESSDFLQLNDDKTQVRRIEPIAEEPPDVDDRTIYVENLPPTADHEWVKKVFSSCGRIVYVSLPKFKHNQRPKGFAFVEFDSTDSALKSLRMRGLVSGEDKDERKSKSDHTPSGPASTPTEKSSLKRSGELVPGTGASAPKRVRFLSPATGAEEKDSCTAMTEGAQAGNRQTTAEDGQCVRDRGKDTDGSNSMTGNLQKGQGVCTEDQTSKSDGAKSTLSETPDVSGTETTVAKKKKIRKRKLKKCKKEKNADGSVDSKLRIMSKKEWLELRKEYLKLQRKSMSQLKKNILSVEHTIHTNQPQSSPNPNKVQPPEERPLDEDKEKVRVISGTVLQFGSDTPLNDLNAKDLKSSIREFSDGVEYVEAEVGQSCAYVRFCSPTQAKRFFDDWPKKNGWGSKHMKILDGAEEAEYQVKIQEHRNKKKGKKTRGKARLIKKAETASAKQASHIRFDEDSNDGI